MNSSCKQWLLWWQGVMVYLFSSQKHTRGYEAIKAYTWACSWPSWESLFCLLVYRRLMWRELELWSQVATPLLELLPTYRVLTVWLWASFLSKPSLSLLMSENGDNSRITGRIKCSNIGESTQRVLRKCLSPFSFPLWIDGWNSAPWDLWQLGIRFGFSVIHKATVT